MNPYPHFLNPNSLSPARSNDKKSQYSGVFKTGSNKESNLLEEIEHERRRTVSLEDPEVRDRVHKIMGMQNLADITLAGYAIKLIRLKGPTTFQDLAKEISVCYEALRRADGSKYNGDLVKALKGCLSSSEAFNESSEGLWTIDEKEARSYEIKTTQKIKALLDKKKSANAKKSEKESQDIIQISKPPEKIAVAFPGQSKIVGPSLMQKQNSNREINQKREPPSLEKMIELLDTTRKAYKMEEKTKYLVQNPFQDIEGDENPGELSQKLGKEKLLGILQCFEYFSPVIEGYIKIKSLNTLNNESRIYSGSPDYNSSNRSSTIDCKANEKE